MAFDLGLYCLNISNKKDARLIWVNCILASTYTYVYICVCVLTSYPPGAVIGDFALLVILTHCLIQKIINRFSHHVM